MSSSIKKAFNLLLNKNKSVGRLKCKSLSHLFKLWAFQNALIRYMFDSDLVWRIQLMIIIVKNSCVYGMFHQEGRHIRET